MDTLFALCKLSLQTSDLQWGLEYFTDDPALDDIYPGLRQIILDGKNNEYNTGFYKTIWIDDIESRDKVHVKCFSSYSKETGTTVKRMFWNLVQIGTFLDYLNNHDIHPC